MYNSLAKFCCSSAATDLVGFIREEDSVEDLGGVVLNGINFYQVRRVATNTSADGGEDKLCC